MAWVLVGIYLLGITPLRLGLHLALGNGQCQLTMGLLVWGKAFRLQAALARGANGRPGRILRWQGKALSPSRKASASTKGLFGAVRALGQAKAARTLLRRSVRLLRIRAAAKGENAAHVALAAAALRALGVPCVPRFGGKSALALTVMWECRLGPVLLAGALAAIRDKRAGKKEEKAWIIPWGV